MTEPTHHSPQTPPVPAVPIHQPTHPGQPPAVFGLGILYYQVESNKIADAYGVGEGQQVSLLV